MLHKSEKASCSVHALPHSAYIATLSVPSLRLLQNLYFALATSTSSHQLVNKMAGYKPSHVVHRMFLHYPNHCCHRGSYRWCRYSLVEEYRDETGVSGYKIQQL